MDGLARRTAVSPVQGAEVIRQCKGIIYENPQIQHLSDKKMMMDAILEQWRDEMAVADCSKIKVVGDAFERLCIAYLTHDPEQKNQYRGAMPSGRNPLQHKRQVSNQVYVETRREGKQNMLTCSNHEVIVMPMVKKSISVTDQQDIRPRSTPVAMAMKARSCVN